MMLRFRTVVVGLASVLPLLAVVVLGEPFYQRRDHMDQDKYVKPSNNTNVVKDLTDAELRFVEDFLLPPQGYAKALNVDGCPQDQMLLKRNGRANKV
ncbi:hypothetical protein ElyMa_000836600 [Elysia marginata]|uniref:Uncharacterized protein n=1 Tax=Elysia marginata TaxID=1093978 RepID=A0AAV4H1R1_9GAST|nr:hypothetical protein ElyMa_000836600 [Elysia marginata]